MSYPTISVITPSFNQGQFLESTILSVLGQGYPALEYIIIDGGSTDNSVEVIKRYEKQLRYWVSEKDKGQSNAINKGFGMAKGDILIWLNSDDLLMPNTLHRMAQIVREGGDGIYFGNCIHFKENEPGLEAQGSDVVSAHRKYKLEDCDYIIQPSSFWTANVYREVGPLREDLHFGFDWEWFLRAKSRGVRLTPVNECFSLYRFHKDHKSGTGGRRRQQELLSIYQAFNVRGAGLFGLLIEKDARWSRFEIYRARLLKNYYRLLNKPLSEAKLLQTIKPGDYRSFTEDEITSMLFML